MENPIGDPYDSWLGQSTRLPESVTAEKPMVSVLGVSQFMETH